MKTLQKNIIILVLSLFSSFYSSASFSIEYCRTGMDFTNYGTCDNALTAFGTDAYLYVCCTAQNGAPFVHYVANYAPPLDPVPDDFNDGSSCTSAGFYWDGSRCVSKPWDSTDRIDCLSHPAGYHWYDNSCHLEPPPNGDVVCWDESTAPTSSECPPAPPPPAPKPEDSNTAQECKADGFYWDANLSTCLAQCLDGTQAGADNICYDKPPSSPECPNGTIPDGSCAKVDIIGDTGSCPDGYHAIFNPNTGENQCAADDGSGFIPFPPAFCSQEYSTGSFSCSYHEEYPDCASVELLRKQCGANPDFCTAINSDFGMEGECRDYDGWIGIFEDFPEETPIAPTLQDCGDGLYIPTDQTCPVKDPVEKPAEEEPVIEEPYVPPSGGDGDGTGGDDSGGGEGGTGDPTKPTSTPVSTNPVNPAPTDITNPDIDPCLNGGCPTDSTDPTAATDYARQATLQANVQVNQAIGQLIQDIRFQELSAMVKFTHDSSNSLDVIETYQALNQDKMHAIKTQIGLQRVDDVAFYKLATQGTDQTNTELKNIYNLTDWSTNKIIESSHDQTKLLSQIKNNSDSKLDIDAQQLTELKKITDATNSTADELKGLKDLFKDDGSTFDAVDTTASIGDLVGTSGKGLADSIGLDLDDLSSSAIGKMGDTSEIAKLNEDAEASKNSILGVFTIVPSATCTASNAINQTFTIQGTTRTFNINPCDRLAELKLALSFVFAYYSARTAFNNIFAPKGA